MFNHRLLQSLQSHTILLISCIVLSTLSLSGQMHPDASKIWVGTWITAPQLVEPYNNPPEPGLTNNSLRQIVRVSIGGDMLRMKFSNEFSASPVTMKSVKIAVSKGGSAIDESTIKSLTFGGKKEFTMEPGGTVTSDPVAFSLKPRMDVAITICFDSTSASVTGHPGSRTTSYLLAGNDPSVNDFSGTVTTDHWYVINGIDVLTTPDHGCVAILGNSITDGRGSVTNMQNRWPDDLAVRLLGNPATEKLGVLNTGIGGNCVLKQCLGPSGLSRYERDILDQQGVRLVIVFEGVNDIGGVKNAVDATAVSNGLIEAYKLMIDAAHARHLKIYGATITPFKGNGYYNEYSEACKDKVNDWIRNSGRFDGVLDFDKYLRDPKDTLSLVASYQNDHLHPTAEEYQRLVDSIDLKMFEGLGKPMPAMGNAASR